MKPSFLSKQLYLIVLLLLSSLTGWAQDYHPEALGQIVQRVTNAAAQGDRPVVVFDLDDTLIDTRYRNLNILKNFIAQKSIASIYPNEVKLAAQAQVSELGYDLDDVLPLLGIHNAAFKTALDDFWAKTFFTNEYLKYDEPIAGATSYVQSLYRAGGTIVYLTGRDEDSMEAGTLASLCKMGFPVQTDRAVLMLKGDAYKGLHDIDFKNKMIPVIEKMGTVVGAFENEPANINVLHEGFAEAIAIFVDSRHSQTSIAPENGVEWVRDFTSVL